MYGVQIYTVSSALFQLNHLWTHRSSRAGIVERHVLCPQNPVHLAESAAPSGSSLLRLQYNLEAETDKQLRASAG